MRQNLIATLRISPSCTPLSRLDQPLPIRRRTIYVDFSWEILLEVFNEYYHLPFVHAGSIDIFSYIPDSLDALTGAYASQFGTTQGTQGLLKADQEKSLPEIPELTGRSGKGGRYTWVCPNKIFRSEPRQFVVL